MKLLLGLLALGGSAIGSQFLGQILEKVEVFNKIWTLISYHNRVDENRHTLKRKFDTLCSVEDDVKKALEVAEFRHGKKRKREVENWLSSVQRTKKHVQDMNRKIENRKYSLGPWWEARLGKTIHELEELYEQGKFEDRLLDANETSRNEFLTTTLVGQNSDGGVLARILACLMNDTVLRIGIYGVEGVGKTAISLHIHNQLLKSAAFDNVYWISVSDDFSIHKLQNDIAKEAGVDLCDEEDTRKRATKIHEGLLRRKKCVLVLDGLLSYFHKDEVGIPTQENGCKLVITARTLKLCRRMDCQEVIEIEALSDREADQLFREKIGFSDATDPQIEEILSLVVEECGRLPMKIISVAQTMIGVDDINEWRNILNELSECRGFNHHLYQLVEYLD